MARPSTGIRYIEARTNLGNAYKELGRLSDAQAAYERVLTLNPDHAEAHNNLGVVLRKNRGGWMKRGLVSACHRLEADSCGGTEQSRPGAPGTGRLDDAIRCFERALQIVSGYGTALYNLGIAWIWREDIPRALRCLRNRAAKHARRPVAETTVFRSRLKHDAEQLEYLRESGLLGDEWNPYHEASLDCAKNWNTRRPVRLDPQIACRCRLPTCSPCGLV